MLNEPFVNVKPPVLVKASANAHSAPTPLTAKLDCSVTPLVVNVLPVLEPDNVIAPVYVLVRPVAGRVTLP